VGGKTLLRKPRINPTSRPKGTKRSSRRDRKKSGTNVIEFLTEISHKFENDGKARVKTLKGPRGGSGCFRIKNRKNAEKNLWKGK